VIDEPVRFRGSQSDCWRITRYAVAILVVCSVDEEWRFIPLPIGSGCQRE
jgi:hypothetical protein